MKNLPLWIFHLTVIELHSKFQEIFLISNTYLYLELWILFHYFHSNLSSSV